MDQNINVIHFKRTKALKETRQTKAGELEYSFRVVRNDVHPRSGDGPVISEYFIHMVYRDDYGALRAVFQDPDAPIGYSGNQLAMEVQAMYKAITSYPVYTMQGNLLTETDELIGGKPLKRK